jgi:hypothetical protein
MVLEETGSEDLDWSHLVTDKGLCFAVVNTALGSITSSVFLINRPNVTFSTTTLVSVISLRSSIIVH